MHIHHSIRTVEDVKAFIRNVAFEIDNFHVSCDFEAYVYPNSYFRRYTVEEAEYRNQALSECMTVLQKQGYNPFICLPACFANYREPEKRSIA